MKNGFASFRTPANRKARQGFTLTELLLVIIIMAILAALSITVQRSAVESARRERTIVTIRKIDSALTSAYEKYQYRKPDVDYFLKPVEESFSRDPEFHSLSDEKRQQEINKRAFDQIYKQWWEFPHLPRWSEKEGQLLFSKVSCRLLEEFADFQLTPYIIRTLMLRENLLADFPDSIHEVRYEMQMGNSPVHSAYQSRLRDLWNGVKLEKNGSIAEDSDISADLLYLIVMNTSPEARGAFLDREIADTNGNGIPEFVDGWGTPIRFIRWAPNLNRLLADNDLPESDRQPSADEEYHYFRPYFEAKVKMAYGESLSDDEFAAYDETARSGLSEDYANPFDPMESLTGWLLTPLIYSAGPDKQFGTFGMDYVAEHIDDDDVFRYPNEPTCFLNPFMEDVEILIPFKDSVLDKFKDNDEFKDNITNHNLE